MKKLLILGLGALALSMEGWAATYTVVTAGAPTYASGGGDVVFNVTLSYPANAVPSLSAKPPATTWAFVAASGASVPTVKPQSNATTDPTDPDDSTSTFGFSYTEPPATSASFSFTLRYPAGLTGDQVVNLAGDYRLGGVRTVVTVPSVTLSLVDRVVRVVSQSASGGTNVVVPVELVATGSENAVGFTLIFDPAQLSYVSTALGAQAAGASLTSNSSQIAAGKLGIALSKPINTTWTAGTQEIVKITFFVNASLPAGTVPTLTFGDSPILREISDVAGLALPGSYQDGTITVPASLEADMNGNGSVSVTDWVKVGRIVAGLDPMPTGGDFMKADCAPRSTLGNGSISTTDWVQAGRYAAGLDPLNLAGGPTGPP